MPAGSICTALHEERRQSNDSLSCTSFSDLFVLGAEQQVQHRGDGLSFLSQSGTGFVTFWLDRACRRPVHLRWAAFLELRMVIMYAVPSVFPACGWIRGLLKQWSERQLTE